MYYKRGILGEYIFFASLEVQKGKCRAAKEKKKLQIFNVDVHHWNVWIALKKIACINIIL